MIKVSKNSKSFNEIIDTIINDITSNSLKPKIENNKHELLKVFKNYEFKMIRGQSYSILQYNFSKSKKLDPSVIGDIRHSELVSLYDKYFVPKRYNSRITYDEILSSSIEGCPYCGGIRDSEEVDHFLPKSKYPQFSVLTSNLVPSCKTCNQDLKKSIFPKSYEEQIIHPYLDDSIFFDEKWIDVKIDVSQSPELKFYVSPPHTWSSSNIEKAKYHFELFNLALRYANYVAKEYESIKQQIDKLKHYHTNKIISNCILQHVIDDTKNPNDCRRVLFEALKRELLKNGALVVCLRCNGSCKIVGLTCDLCKGMGSIPDDLVVSYEKAFGPVECPECSSRALDLDCSICRGEGMISLDKAKNI